MIRSAGACLVFALASSIALAAATGEIPSPDEFLGHEVGADRYLAPYDQVLAYMRALAEASPRVAVEVAGRSTLGREMVIVVLTSETNQRSLPRYREIARRLAHPEGLGEETARALIDEGKTIALITCTIHSTEVGSTQMAMEFAHKVATTRDPRMLRWLDDVILLLMPSINPDGQAMVIDWYNKHLGTQYEGGRMPWLYHHYVGHDDNRDFYMLTQKETQVVNDVLYHRWFPQVFLDEHQMGSTGPRMFVPPQTDPVAPEIDSMILRFADLLGTGMGLRLEEAGKQGVGRDMIYDSYWPGGTRNTAWWKNIVGLLTEVASARIATPIYIEPGELKGGRKGFPDYVRRANYLTPWTGGWWRLRDIIDYELIATQALLEGCSRYREDLLANVHRLAQQEIRRGRTEPPYAFVIPPGQHDPVAAALMVDLLLRHGIRVERSDALLALGDPNSTRSIVPSGSYVVRTSQPYRPFVLTMLQPQRYPEVLDAVGGKVIPPYDVTSWSLPVAMGVDVMRVDEPLDPSAHLHAITSPAWPGGAVEPSRQGYLAAHSADSSFIAANRLLGLGKQVYWLEQPPADAAIGDLYIPADQVTAGELETLSSELHLPIRPLARRPAGRAFRLHPVRVGLYKPWLASIDEGWTRWLLERYEFPLVSLTNKQLRSGSFK
ncbi:MAG: M14 metallopeptidase family protein, partial [Acidobacteriota bacterium]